MLFGVQRPASIVELVPDSGSFEFQPGAQTRKFNSTHDSRPIWCSLQLFRCSLLVPWAGSRYGLLNAVCDCLRPFRFCLDLCCKSALDLMRKGEWPLILEVASVPFCGLLCVRALWRCSRNLFQSMVLVVLPMSTNKSFMFRAGCGNKMCSGSCIRATRSLLFVNREYMLFCSSQPPRGL